MRERDGRQWVIGDGDARQVAQLAGNSGGGIEYAFDDVCSDSRTASMNAIRVTFKDYIWSCVN